MSGLDVPASGEDETQLENVDNRLSSYEALLLALVLENSMLQLRILEGCSATEGAVSDAGQKLLVDRGTVRDAVRATLAELLARSRYGRLRALVSEMRAARARAAAADATHAQLLRTCSEAEESCRAQRREQHAREAAADARAASLRDTLEDEAVNSNVRLSYVERWQRARAETPAMRAHLAAPRRCDARPLQHEARVHEELARAYDVATQELDVTTEQWRERYHAHVADMNLRLLERSQQLRDTLAKRKHLQELYATHAGEMNSWLTFKRERAARLAREARRAASAALLQAWWRGVMVRRGLGAFKALRAKKPPAKQGKKKA